MVAGMASVDVDAIRNNPLNTYVIIPTYNEADNLETLIGEILALPVEVGVINVDDNSPDGTGQLADRLAAQHPGRVIAVHRPGRLGLGTAYLAGIARAFELGAARILTMDADFSHHPRHIIAMLAKCGKADLVIGSRYVPGGGVRFVPWYRRVLSRGANVIARSVVGLAARDATAGFRLYRREVLESIPLEQIFSSGYSFLVEILYLVQQRGWRVTEVPIVFEDRRAGATKISRVEILRALYTVARLGWLRLRAR
jgi:glycosyltransferase involved in cell wall biosynthesis